MLSISYPNGYPKSINRLFNRLTELYQEVIKILSTCYQAYFLLVNVPKSFDVIGKKKCIVPKEINANNIQKVD